MQNMKFLVRLKRAGASGPQYLLGIGKSSIKTTADRKRALRMGKYTAQDAIDFIQNARCTGELVPVKVTA
jgi:hypothetical protein